MMQIIREAPLSRKYFNVVSAKSQYRIDLVLEAVFVVSPDLRCVTVLKIEFEDCMREFELNQYGTSTVEKR